MRFTFVVFLCLLCYGGSAQVRNNPSARPKLVVGIVVDQMRWDYLYRYYNRYAADGGFRRLIDQGFSCENAFINYIPSYTACGHTCIYTGSVPAIHGITGNEWYDYDLNRLVYCAEDSTVHGLGTTEKAGQMSPRNLQVTTVCDELRLATNFRSKVIGIAMKDRGGILPAGHTANAAYWYESASGNWVSSDYYQKQLPAWVSDFNAKKLPDSYFKKGWNTLYPLDSYVQSTPDEQPYEGKPFGEEAKGFPYSFEQFVGKKYSVLPATPYGNSLTKDLAIAAVKGEGLGKDSVADFLAISFSSTDYVGHAFGPNSIEAEDTYLRLDRDLGELFRYLDQSVGKGQYLVFLSADHGVAHAPGFAKANKVPGGGAQQVSQKTLDSVLHLSLGDHHFVLALENNQVFFDRQLLDSLKIDRHQVSKVLIDYLSIQPGVDKVVALDDNLSDLLPDAIRSRISYGYYRSRSGDIQIILKSGWMSGGRTGTTHGSWNPYDTHIPMVFYGWKVKPGKTNRETYMTDIAPTVAAMLHIQMPSGCIGKVVTELQ